MDQNTSKYSKISIYEKSLQIDEIVVYLYDYDRYI